MESATIQTQADGIARLPKGARALKLAACSSVLLLLLFILWQAQHNLFRLSVGQPLPRGKVVPQLFSGAWDVGVLLAPDGSLWCWGGTEGPRTALVEEPNQEPQRIGSAHDWCQLAASYSHALALKTDGSLWEWGSTWALTSAQSEGPRRKVTEPTRIGTDSDWAQIAVGDGHSLALKRDGSLWSWGQNDHGQVGDSKTGKQPAVTQIGHDQDWIDITAGADSSFALKKDRTLWGWGFLT